MIEVRNLTRQKINKVLFERIGEIILKSENKKDWKISVVFVGEKRIKYLNKKYRKRNRITDVLAFENLLFKNLNFLNSEKELGEVVICLSKVKKNAKKFKVSFKEELMRVFIHGILHLLGYNHEKSKKSAKKMLRKEEKFLKIIENLILKNKK